MPNTNTINKEVASAEATSIKLYSDNNQNSSQNQAESMFERTELWPEPVDGAELADFINGQLKKYLYLPDGTSEVVTLWILHTYCVNMFDFSPRLCITSPEKRCGKTTLLRMVEHLSHRSLNVSNVTTAALFRVIDTWHPTMLIDEADTFLKTNEELRGIINAGFQKDGKVSRIETVGKMQNVKLFKCFSPVGIAAIGSLPGTILDRGIIISMRRKNIRTRYLGCVRVILLQLHRKSATNAYVLCRITQRLLQPYARKYQSASMTAPQMPGSPYSLSPRKYPQTGELVLKEPR